MSTLLTSFLGAMAADLMGIALFTYLLAGSVKYRDPWYCKLAAGAGLVFASFHMGMQMALSVPFLH